MSILRSCCLFVYFQNKQSNTKKGGMTKQKHRTVFFYALHIVCSIRIGFDVLAIFLDGILIELETRKLRQLQKG